MRSHIESTGAGAAKTKPAKPKPARRASGANHENKPDDVKADAMELAPSAATETGSGADAAAGPALRPALLAGYRNLAALRHDFPLLLVAGEGGEGGDGWVRSLSGMIDGILQDIAPQGAEGEALRRQLLGLEREVRALVSRGAGGSLSELWTRAAKQLRGVGDADASSVADNLARARNALRLDGAVIDCDAESPAKLFSHAWTTMQRAKTRAVLDEINELVLGLSDILKADFMRSDAARAPAALKGAVGTSYEAEFDFDALSRLLTDASPRDALPEPRRRRIGAALSVLQAQRFFAPAVAGEDNGEGLYSFAFESCEKAREALQDRLPAMVALIKAIAIAELEIENRYKAATHDAFFESFDENTLTPEGWALFPTYLICLRDAALDAAETATLIELLSSSLPMKIMLQSDDILAGPALGPGSLALGTPSTRLANMAVGLGGAYVLQASGASLYRLRHRIRSGLEYAGPALFSLFSGAGPTTPGLRPYLAAAAAEQSRAFPVFSYNPAAGRDWASRFSVADNPQAAAAWPVQHLAYEDENHQRLSEDVAFTVLDFVACDRRYGEYFSAVPRSEWHARMVPAVESLTGEAGGAPEATPYLLMIDESDALQRVVVDHRLLQAARRCGETWHSLQELGGIDNSHAKRLLESERELWEQEKAREIEALRGQAAPAPPEPAVEQALPAAVAEAPAPEVAAAEAEEAPPSDDPYIETARCTTCNECTDLNNRMFAYDDNMQAYIADPDAGTYRQLVEAAEACQVAILHPGKPRNPDEPNLADLIERAADFE